MREEAEVEDESAPGRSGPDLGGREILVPGGYGTAFVARAGQLVEIVDVEGQQVADLVAFAGRNRTEWLSTTHTRSAILRLTVRVGDRLESNWRRPLFEILRDDVGRNAIITRMCDDRRYQPALTGRGHRAGRERHQPRNVRRRAVPARLSGRGPPQLPDELHRGAGTVGDRRVADPRS